MSRRRRPTRQSHPRPRPFTAEQMRGIRAFAADHLDSHAQAVAALRPGLEDVHMTTLSEEWFGGQRVAFCSVGHLLDPSAVRLAGHARQPARTASTPGLPSRPPRSPEGAATAASEPASEPARADLPDEPADPSGAASILGR